MGMTAELEIYACIFRVFQVERLMVEKYGESSRSICQFRERLATAAASVVPADDVNALNFKVFVFEQPDARCFEERLSILHAAKVLVVAEHRKYGSLQPMELRSKIFLE